MEKLETKKMSLMILQGAQQINKGALQTSQGSICQRPESVRKWRFGKGSAIVRLFLACHAILYMAAFFSLNHPAGRAGKPGTDNWRSDVYPEGGEVTRNERGAQ